MISKRAPHVRAATTGRSLTDEAYDRLEELIVTLELAPGSLISENDVSERIGIGRTPVREALQRLAREKLVVILPRRGMFVSELNVAEQLQLLELRREVERLMARAAARRSDANTRAGFAVIADNLEAAAAIDDDLVFMREDRELNDQIARHAGNTFAAISMNLWRSLSRRFWFHHYRETADMPLAAKLHANLARAIASGDPDAAANASDELLNYLEEFTRATVVGRH
jgi:DNA-binding GntR family transcriptional regulator